MISKYQQTLNLINELNQRCYLIKDPIFWTGKNHSYHLYAIIYRNEQFVKEFKKIQID